MFHLRLKKCHNLNELFRDMAGGGGGRGGGEVGCISIISGHIVMYGIKL